MEQLTVRALGSVIGAEVQGVRVDADLDAATVDALRALVTRHKVVFLRGQHHLRDEDLVAVAGRFGTPLPGHPLLPCDPPEVLRFEADAQAPIGEWRQDMSFLADPPALSFRLAVRVPAYGGNSMWANTAAAFAALPAPFQHLCRNLWAIHHLDPHAFDLEETRGSASFDTQHPVVRAHPDTGEECLVLGDFVQALVGLEPHESALVLQLLHARVTQPANTVRWDAQAGDLLISDNRATLNCTVVDFGEGSVEVSRVSVLGPPAPVRPGGPPAQPLPVTAVIDLEERRR